MCWTYWRVGSSKNAHELLTTVPGGEGLVSAHKDHNTDEHFPVFIITDHYLFPFTINGTINVFRHRPGSQLRACTQCLLYLSTTCRVCFCARVPVRQTICTLRCVSPPPKPTDVVTLSLTHTHYKLQTNWPPGCVSSSLALWWLLYEDTMWSSVSPSQWRWA